MTTPCPIIRKCIQQLKLSFDRGLFPDLDLDELISDAEGVSDDHSLVRLRGFTAIAEMLKLVKDQYDNKYKVPSSPNLSLELKIWSWGSLTQVKDELTKLKEEVEVELGEATLEGHRVNDDGHASFLVLRAEKPDDAESPIIRSRRLQAARLLRRIVPVVHNAVVAFRPYLSNDDSHISSVGNSLAWVTREVDGEMHIVRLYTLTRKLMEAKL